MQELIKIYEIKTRRRCPRCASPIIRSSSGDGGHVYSFFERCDCGWSKTYENVRV